MSSNGAEVVDADGLVALPGLVDLHTHLREPGREDAETVETGTQAAAVGGFTAVHAMANTDPVADTAGVVEQVWRPAARRATATSYPSVPSPWARRRTAGRAGRDGGLGSPGAGVLRRRQVRLRAVLMRRALEYVKAFDGVVAQHAQEPRLTEEAQMNEGELRPARAARLAGGRRGGDRRARLPARRQCRLQAPRLPRLDRGLGGDRALGQEQGVERHRGGMSAPPAADRRAGRDYDPVYKVNPPLALGDRRRGAREGLADGTSTSSPPTTPPTRTRTRTASGRPPLRHARPRDRAVDRAADHGDTGLLDWAGVAARMSSTPARIGRLSGHGRPLEVGAGKRGALRRLRLPGRRPHRPGIAVAQHPVRRSHAARPRRRDVHAGRPTVLDGKVC